MVLSMIRTKTENKPGVLCIKSLLTLTSLKTRIRVELSLILKKKKKSWTLSLFLCRPRTKQTKKGLYTKRDERNQPHNGEKCSRLRISSFRPCCNGVIPHMASLPNFEAPQQHYHRHQCRQSSLLGPCYDGGIYVRHIHGFYFLSLPFVTLFSFVYTHVIMIQWNISYNIVSS